MRKYAAPREKTRTTFRKAAVLTEEVTASSEVVMGVLHRHKRIEQTDVDLQRAREVLVFARCCSGCLLPLSFFLLWVAATAAHARTHA